MYKPETSAGIVNNVGDTALGNSILSKERLCFVTELLRLGIEYVDVGRAGGAVDPDTSIGIFEHGVDEVVTDSGRIAEVVAKNAHRITVEPVKPGARSHPDEAAAVFQEAAYIIV